ncbi:hypothetical protein BX600DRAFT_474961 [Xylariales sp. PMI_506]|nr:hypothetical protein BX600DRAFT_474961 [Xylariales sp. PMI_506]
MATSAPYPTFEELVAQKVDIKGISRLSQDHRATLLWPLEGTLETAISFIPDHHDLTNKEPYFNDGSWHPISKEPLTEPKVSSITVRVRNTSDWETVWLDFHKSHAVLERLKPMDGIIAAVCEGKDISELERKRLHPDYVPTKEGLLERWGLLSDYEAEDGPENERTLLRCCYGARPRKKNYCLVVTPAIVGDNGGSYITVHDYLSAVHPWLLSLRDELLVAVGSQLWFDPLPPSTELMIDSTRLDMLSVTNKEESALDGTATTSSSAPETLGPSGTASQPSTSSLFNAVTSSQPHYPTYEDLRRRQKENIPTETFSMEFNFTQGIFNPPTLFRERVMVPSLEIGSIRRFPDVSDFYWLLEGTLADALSIITVSKGKRRMVPYCNNGRWHSISKAPLVEPKISSLTVRTYNTSAWEDEWLDYHSNHAVKGAGGSTWGPLPDYDPEEDGPDSKDHLLACCGFERPRKKDYSITIVPEKDGQGFLTVHDYFSAMHPWLMSLREEFLVCLRSTLWFEPLPASTKLMVLCSDILDEVIIETKSESTLVQEDQHTSAPMVRFRQRETGRPAGGWQKPYDEMGRPVFEYINDPFSHNPPTPPSGIWKEHEEGRPFLGWDSPWAKDGTPRFDQLPVGPEDEAPPPGPTNPWPFTYLPYMAPSQTLPTAPLGYSSMKLYTGPDMNHENMMTAWMKNS